MNMMNSNEARRRIAEIDELIEHRACQCQEDDERTAAIAKKQLNYWQEKKKWLLEALEVISHLERAKAGKPG